MTDRYSTNVHWSDEDSCYIATCHEFPLLSAFGDSKEEALAEFQIVLELAIESYEENTLELPEPRTSVTHSGQFRLRLPKSLHRDMVEAAEKEGVSLNTYAISVITRNHTLKQLYDEKIRVLEDVLLEIKGAFVSHHSVLQVHSKRLDFIEAVPDQNSVSLPKWSLTNDAVITTIQS